MPIAQHSCIFPATSLCWVRARYLWQLWRFGPPPPRPLVTLGHTEVADLITHQHSPMIDFISCHFVLLADWEPAVPRPGRHGTNNIKLLMLESISRWNAPSLECKLSTAGDCARCHDILPTTGQWSQCQWSPPGINTVMRVRVLRALSTRGARTAAHSRPPTTINCCSIHCYNQWESCNRNPGPILQCCMSCSAAVTRDTSVKSAAHHNLQVSVIIRFHKTVKLKEGIRIIKPVTQCQCGGVETYLVSRSWKLDR